MSSSIPLVSIICDTYNHRSYIRQCLEGFINQITDFKYEVLVHDDASTDGTAEIIREFEAKYPDFIKPIYQSVNQYSGDDKIWIRFQFPRANGKYLALCEGDDYWTDPYKLQKQVDFLEENKNCSACFTNAEIINELDNTKRKFIYGLKEGLIPAERSILRGGSSYPTASLVFVRRFFLCEVFEKVRELAGDSLLIITLAMQGDIFFLNQVTCVYRVWTGGVYSSIMNDSKKTIERKKGIVAGLKKLLMISKKPYRKYLRKRISIESLIVLQKGGIFKNLPHLTNLNHRDILRLLIFEININRSNHSHL